MIEKIWSTYDKDLSGYLDKEETRAFVTDFMQMQGLSEQFDDETFEQFFRDFDKDGSGQVER